MTDHETLEALSKVERIARAMAIADGFDPDAQAGGGPNQFALQACDFNGYGVAVYGPTWKLYQRKANLFLAAISAMQVKP